MPRNVTVTGRVHLEEQWWNLYVSDLPAEPAMESEDWAASQSCSTKQCWTWLEANIREVQSACLGYQGLADQCQAG